MTDKPPDGPLAEPPDVLHGEDDAYFRVPDFTDASKRSAVQEALDLAGLDVTDEVVIAAVAATAVEHRLRSHTAATDDCDCGGEPDDSWWCPFGAGPTEGLYVSLDTGFVEDFVDDRGGPAS